MSLVRAIDFSHLAAQLTIEETSRITKDVLESNPQFIIELLSTWFIKQSGSERSNRLSSQCIERISAIIRSRQSDGTEVTEPDTALDTLPRHIIGHCSSFLDQNSYKELSLCNRSIYLGANSPIMLQELNIDYPWKSSLPVDLSSFPMTTTLSVQIGFELDYDVHKVTTIASQIANMPQLRWLNLLNLRYKAVDIIADEEALNRNIEGLWICYESLSYLSAFRNLQFLFLAEVHERNGVANDLNSKMIATKDTFSNLRGLTLRDCTDGIGLELLTAIGPQLEYLALSYVDSYDLKNTDFRNLKQFQVHEECVSGMSKQILKTATNLVSAQISIGEDKAVNGTTEGLSVIDEILANCKKLKYLEIHYDRRGTDILAAIKSGLFRSRKYERKELTIRLFANDFFRSEKDEYLIEKFDEIINQLSICEEMNWMVLLEYEEQQERFKNIIKQLNVMQTMDVCILEDMAPMFSTMAMISNRNCTINGYGVKWLMPQ